MADDNDGKWYNFQWNINHPLIFWLNCENIEKPEASFMIRDVALSRFDFRLCRRSFLPQHCLLSCVITYRASNNTLTCFADVKTRVTWNDVEISNSRYDKFEFNDRSNYSFDMKVNHEEMIHELKCLTISIDIRPRDIKELVNQESFPLTRCAIQLSSDLGKLCEKGYYYNVRITSFRDLRECKMHDFILKQRWPKLFEMHQPELVLGEDIRIRTPISLSVLKRVLYFLYTGKLPADYKFTEYSLENAELAQTMDKYHLYNMYKIFVPRSGCIFRETLVDFEEQSFEIELNYFDENAIPQYSVPFKKLIPYNHYVMVYMSIKQEKHAGFWLSYRLILYRLGLELTHVTLQLYTVGEVNSLLHCREYVLQRADQILSGPIIFLGSSNTFGNFVVDGKLRLLLKMLCSDGKMKHIIFDKSSNRVEEPKYDVALADLSMDMKEVYKSGYRTDCELVSRYESAITRQVFRAHKAIIYTRIPIMNIESKIPVIAFEECINHILNYVYTGRFESIPDSQNVLGNICLFGRLNKFEALLDYTLPKLLEKF